MSLAKEKRLFERIEFAIVGHIQSRGKINHIVLHPKSVKKLWDELCSCLYPPLNKPPKHGHLKYRGIRVLRSKDLCEDEILVG